MKHHGLLTTFDHGIPEPPRQSGEFAKDHAPRSGVEGPTRLLETPYCTLDWDVKRSLVRFVRTELAYATVADIERDGLEIQRVLKKTAAARLLVDLRAVAPRNDPAFESAIVRFRKRLLGGDERIAILVRTAVGALQVKRHLREDGYHAEVLHAEEEALAFLEACVSEPGPRADGDRVTPPLHSWAKGPFNLR